MARSTGKPPGFGTVGETSAGSWWARYTYNGSMHRPGHTFATEKLANAWLAGEKRLIDLETWTPPAERRAQAEAAAKVETTTLDAYARQWLAQRIVKRTGKPLSDRYQEECLRYLDGILQPLPTMPLASITVDDVAEWHAAHADTPTYRARAYSFMKSVFATAVDRDRVVRTPCRIENAEDVEAAHDSDRIVKSLTVERVNIVVENVRPRHQALILLLAWCGIRSGEAFALRRDDLELGTGENGLPFGWLTVERGISTHGRQRHEGSTKTGRLGERVVPIPPHIVTSLRQHLKLHAERGRRGLLFPSSNPTVKNFATTQQVNGWPAQYRKDGTVKKAGAGFYHARDLAGVPELHLHDLRHWASTRWADAGTPDPLRRAILGHAQPGMTGHYTHVSTRTPEAAGYALRVSQMAGWASAPTNAAPAANAGALAAILASMDDAALTATLPSLTAVQVAEVIPQLPPERIAAVLAALAGK